MDTCWRLVICVVLVALFPQASIAVFSGPSDTTVLLGGTAVLNCSYPEFVAGGITQWRKDTTTIANAGGIIPVFRGDYPGVEVIVPSATRLDLVMPDVRISYDGNYECEMSPKTGAARLTVEIQGVRPTISRTSVSLTEGIPGELTCIATGYRPAVDLLWFRNGIRIQTGITENTSASVDTTDTTSVWTFTPTRDFDNDAIECRTDITGRIAPSQTGSYPLNVRYAPVVTVKYTYSSNAVVCSADSNPSNTNNYKIILNKTQVVEEYDTSGRSYKYEPDYCTDISCNVTNSIGTGVGEVTINPICPGHVDPTPTPSMTTDKNKGPDPTAKPEPQGLAIGVIVAIVLCCVSAVALVVVVIVICYFKTLYCFGSNKTKNETSPPKKQPSVINADMIRNQPEVRQSVHKYEDEPKKPRVARAGTDDPGSKDAGKRQPSPQLGRQNVPPKASNDQRQGYPDDIPDGNAQPGGMNYADLEFQDRGRNGHGHTRPVNPPPEEPTQYASILV